MASSADLITAFGHGISALIVLYAAYWAFNIRRALAVRIYRNQALGIGLVCVAFTLLDLVQVAVASTQNQVVSNPLPLFFPFLYFASLMVFYWVDTSTLASRRSDPLLRDTLHWSRVRISLWALTVIFSVLGLLVHFVSGSYSVGPAAFFFFSLGTVLVPSISGALLLTVSARRSRDSAMRKHLKWFGLFAALLTVANVLAPFISTSVTFIFFYGAIFAAGFSLYRSARSLAPINRLSLDDTK